MKVIIAGSRHIDSYYYVRSTIEHSPFFYKIQEVVSGGARGVDIFGEHWAVTNRIAFKRFPANWALHGKAAGPIRNKQMGEYADAAILIWDGESAGTKNMLDTMIRLKKPYFLEAPYNAYTETYRPYSEGSKQIF